MPSEPRACVTLRRTSLGEMPAKEDAGALPLTCGTAETPEGRQNLMSRLGTKWARLVSHPGGFGSRCGLSKRKVNWGLGNAFYSKTTAPPNIPSSVSSLLSQSW